MERLDSTRLPSSPRARASVASAAVVAVLALGLLGPACGDPDLREGLEEALEQIKDGKGQAGQPGKPSDPQPLENPCIAALCPTGTRCVPRNGKAVCEAFDPCAEKACPPDRRCVLQKSSPPQAICVPVAVEENPCNLIDCRPGTTCVVLESRPPQAKCVEEPTRDPCAGVRCKAGTHCEAKAVQCVRAPCPAMAECVPDAQPVRCGGIAGLACPGAGTCVDDPADSCRPGRGADCGGLCACNAIAACVSGLVWDGSPGVCGCVPAKK
jgi:hypothetical protein